MPLGLAARKCPDAVFLPTDRPAYDAASARVMATLRSFPVVVEVWGWDEAFVGAVTDDPEALAREVQQRVRAETGLSCSVGIGETRLQAKTATGFAKPGGVARLTRRTWIDDDGRPPRHRALGHRRAHGAAAGRHWASTPWSSWLGPIITSWRSGSARRSAPTCGCSAWAATSRPWSPSRTSPAPAAGRRPSHVTSPTRAEIEDQVARLAVEVAEAVVAEGRRVTHVAVKVRTPTFFTRTKISKLARAHDRPGRGRRARRPRRARPVRARPAGPPPRRPGDARDAVDPRDDRPADRIRTSESMDRLDLKPA